MAVTTAVHGRQLPVLLRYVHVRERGRQTDRPTDRQTERARNELQRETKTDT